MMSIVLCLVVVAALALIALTTGLRRLPTMARIPVVALVVVGLPTWGFFTIVGWSALKPPLQYGVDISVTLEIDGTVHIVRQGARCSVTDHRDAIVPQGFYVTHSGSNPFLMLEDGRGFVVGNIEPCRWKEDAPSAGVSYAMVDRPEVKAGGRPSQPRAPDYLQVRATLSRVDDVDRPKLIKTVNVRFGDTVLPDVRVRGITLTRNDSPELTSASDSFPYLRARSGQAKPSNDEPLAVRRAWKSEESTQEIIATLYGADAACQDALPPSTVWVEVDGSCRRRELGRALVSTTEDLSRVHLSAVIDKAQPTLVIPEQELVQLQRGYYRNRGNGSDVNYVWAPKICIEGSCAHPSDQGTYQSLTMISPDRKTIVAVVVSPSWLFSIVKYDR